MSPFSEAFHKELGTRTARYLVRGIAAALTALGAFLYLHKQIAIMVSIAIASILLFWLAGRLFFRYYRIQVVKSDFHKKQILEKIYEKHAPKDKP